MPAEIQEKPSVKPMDKTEHASMETPVSKGTKPDRNTGFLKVFCVIVVCLFCLIAGNLVRSNSTLFLEHRTENGYLAPEEYILVDSKTGKPGQNVRTIGLHSMSTNHEYRMRTTRGIGKGSSWQEVVDAYGDVYAYRICYQPDFTGTYDYSKDVWIQGPITLSEFDEQYVKTGQCNPDTDRIWIRFQFWHDTTNIFYTPEEWQNPNRKTSTPWFLTPVSSGNSDRHFELTFSLIPDEGVEYVSSYFM